MKTEMKYDLFLPLGGQGSGKGTHSKLFLQENPGFKYVETGALFRALPEGHPLKVIANSGQFVSDEDTEGLIKENMSQKSNYVLDGFPRQLSQAMWLVDSFADKFNIYAVYLMLTREDMKERIKQRLVEGGGRVDDANEEIVKKRLDSFFEKTVPAIKWLSINPDVKFIEIPVGGKSIDVNYNAIKNGLKSLGMKVR